MLLLHIIVTVSQDGRIRGAFVTHPELSKCVAVRHQKPTDSVLSPSLCFLDGVQGAQFRNERQLLRRDERAKKRDLGANLLHCRRHIGQSVRELS